MEEEEKKDPVNGHEINPDKDARPDENAGEQTENRPRVEEEWAEKLGMDFDPERADMPRPEEIPGSPQPEEYGRAGRQTPPPMYVMSPDTQLPPNTPQPPMPPTFMIWAILSTICCCLPAGVVAIIFSSQVSSKYFARDYEGARKASERTEMWIIASIVLGIIVNALYMPLSLLMPS